MCHKIDTTYLTQKSSDLLKDLWSICLSCFFSCFNSWKATSVYRGYFPAICRLCFFVWYFLEMVFPIHSLSALHLVFSLVNENSLNCTSGVVVLCFLFRQEFCYDHITSQSLQICSNFLFTCSYNFNWCACLTSFFALCGASFLFICVINFLTWLTSLSKMTSSLWNWLFTLIQRDKIKRMCPSKWR